METSDEVKLKYAVGVVFAVRCLLIEWDGPARDKQLENLRQKLAEYDTRPES